MTVEEYTLRPTRAADVPALHALELACHEADGDESIRDLVGFEREWATAVDTRCAERAGEIGAAVCLLPDQAGASWRLAGCVHPVHRRRGLGAALLEWSKTRAAQLAGGPLTLVIRTEALTPGAEALYSRQGFVQTFAEEVMDYDLAGAVPQIPLPEGVRLLPWSAETAHLFFRAYDSSFRDRPGFPGWNADTWIEWTSTDDTFRPDLARVALQGDEPVGFIAVDAEPERSRGWISQVGVRPDQRGRGLGAALCAGVLEAFAREGLARATLHVNVNNPGAIHVYERLGFCHAARRARWSAAVEPHST